MRTLALTLVLTGLTVFGARAADAPTDYKMPEEYFAGPTTLLEIYGGYNWIESNSFDEGEEDAFWMFGGWAGANLPIGAASGAQLEIFGEGTPNQDNDDDNYMWSAGAGAHGYWRNSSQGLVGVMGGAVHSVVGDDEEDDAWAWLGGLEAQAYLGNTTLYGQAGYASYLNAEADDSGQDADFPKDTLFVRGVARHFLAEQTKLEGELGAAFGRFDSEIEDAEDRFSLINWAAEVEHAFGTTMAASLFLRYEGIYAKQSSGDYSTDSTIKIGLRGRFGGAATTLLANDRQGVSLDLPDVGRWGGILNGPIE